MHIRQGLFYRALASVALAMYESDDRPHLGQVQFKPHGPDQVLLSASTGNWIAVYRLNIGEPLPAAFGLAAPLVRILVAALRVDLDKGEEHRDLEVRMGSAKLDVCCPPRWSLSFVTHELQDNAPNLDKYVEDLRPRQAGPARAALNAKLLDPITRAYVIASGNDSPYMRRLEFDFGPTDQDPVLIQSSMASDLTCVLAPMRRD